MDAKGQCRALSFLWDLVWGIETRNRYSQVFGQRVELGDAWKGMTAQLTLAWR